MYNVCRECNKTFDTIEQVNRHLRSHSLTAQEYSLKWNYDGVIPKCECGCGQETTWSNALKRYNEYVHGHHAFHREKSDEEKRKIGVKNSENMKRYMSEHPDIAADRVKKMQDGITAKSHENRRESIKKYRDSMKEEKERKSKLEELKRFENVDFSDVNSTICKLCGKELENRKGLSCHVSVMHKTKFQEYVIRFDHNGTWPLCKCGCGGRVKFWAGKFVDYIDHHQPGKSLSEETKQKLRDVNTGKTASEETKRKMSKTHTERYASDPNIAVALSEKLKGRTLSEETKRKLSVTRSERIKSGDIVINRDKISKTMCEKYMSDSFSWSTGTYVSTKTGKTCAYRSSYELKYMQLLDVDDDVLDWSFEPFALEYQFEGKKRRYIPDFLVTRLDHVELVEVKPEALRDTAMNESKRLAALKMCAKQDIRYVEWTAEHDDKLLTS